MNKTNTDNLNEIISFNIGETFCGLNIQQIQEIIKIPSLTKVPNAEEYIIGILNLRGNIVTLVDLSIKLAINSIKTDESRIIIVDLNGERIGLMVDKIADVITFTEDEISPPPENIKGVQGKFFSGVLKLDNELLALLNIEEILAH